MNFLETIKKRAKTNPKTIVLPETNDKRILEAASIILKENIAKIILIGKKNEILRTAESTDLSTATIIDPTNFSEMDNFAKKLVEIRKSKGLTLEEAKELVQNPLYLGVMLVNEGIADGMVAGAVYSTANVLRPSLQILKTSPGTKLVSAFFMVVVPDCDFGNNGLFLFSDCGLNQNPNAEQLANIAISSAESFKKLTSEEPIVAMLSHSTMKSASHADVDKVTEATKIAKELSPELKLDGELQLDAAIVPEIGLQKAPHSLVAGKANVLVFPNLDSGNIGYKLVERLAKANAYGPVLQGIRKPVNDLSRGCNVQDIVGVIAITVVQAQVN